MVNWKIIKDPNAIFNFRNKWNQLYASNNFEVSTSFEWTDALLTTHIEGKDNFILIVLEDIDDIVGIVPLVLINRRKFGQSLVTLSPLSELYNTHSDLLIKNISNELIVTFIKAIFSFEHKWDIFRMNRILEQNPIIKFFELGLNKMHAKSVIRRSEPSFFITLENNYQSYLKRRSSKFRNYLKRVEKKINSQGVIEFYSLEDYSSISDAYSQLLFIEEKSWKQRYGTSISNICRQQNFYEKLCNGASKNGFLHLNFLYLNNKPIAYNLGLLKDNIYLYLKTSFNEELRKFSPATVLRAKLIEELINNQIQFFDFPGEPYEWESQWADEIRWHKSLSIIKPTIKSTILIMYEKLKNHKNVKLFNKNKFNYHDPLAHKEH